MAKKSDTRWDGLTVAGALPIGVYYAGTRHKDFVLRIPLAGDLIGAHEKHPQGIVHTITLDLFQRQLLQLGDIPSEAITFELLRDELTEIDLAALNKADATLGKKFASQSELSSTGGASSTHLSEPVTG